MIPKTYHDEEKEDRRFTDDLWSWLKDQPQDAWLLWVRNANWDNADTIFERMIDDPRCDLAIGSWLFWNSEPSYYVRNPTSAMSGMRFLSKIASSVESGRYKSSDLYLSRYEIVFGVHEYIKAVRETAPAASPFPVPRILFGPFNGRHASLPERYDEVTERGLEEIFLAIDGWLPRSESLHRERQVSGGNNWIEARLKLPAVPADPIRAYSRLDDTAYAEALFGKSAAYQAARNPQAKKTWWPFG